VPALGASATKVNPAGCRSVTCTPVALLGPLFVAVTVKMTLLFWLGVELSTVFVTAMSAATGVMVALAESFPGVGSTSFSAVLVAVLVVGAVVLIGLGAQALFRSRREHEDTELREQQLDGAATSTPSTAGRGGWSAYRAGLVTNLANPKAGVFAISFLPQFIPRGYPVLPTGLLLAAVWVICDATWYLTLTAIVHLARRMFSRGVVRQRLEALSGVALVGFGVRLALESR